MKPKTELFLRKLPRRAAASMFYGLLSVLFIAYPAASAVMWTCSGGSLGGAVERARSGIVASLDDAAAWGAIIGVAELFAAIAVGLCLLAVFVVAPRAKAAACRNRRRIEKLEKQLGEGGE